VKAKPVVLRAQAQQDIDEAIAYYLGEGGQALALRFVDTLEQATSHIARQPGTGSPRYGHELNLPGLRSWPVSRFEHLLFYVEHDDHVDLWRVLHGRWDMAAWLNEPESG
jgi:toxin ParE1/3/4